MKILLAEDDHTIAVGLEYSLQQEGYQVDICPTADAAKQKILHNTYNLYLLDLALPDGNGYDLCRLIKQRQDVPVIFLTACDDEVNIVMGLDLGADDYITKPFRIRELMSRIRSVIRRYHKSESHSGIYESEQLIVNTRSAQVYRGREEIFLTALEYRLLLTLLNHQGQVLTRNQLLEGIWDVAGDFVNDNTLTVYIKRLREKLGDNGVNTIIATVRGTGYRLEAVFHEK